MLNTSVMKTEMCIPRTKGFYYYMLMIINRFKQHAQIKRSAILFYNIPWLELEQCQISGAIPT
jgi:hypothetical protein